MNFDVPLKRVMLVKESRAVVFDAPISSSGMAIQLMEALFREFRFPRETFVVAYLDTKKFCVGLETVTTGTLDASLVHPREVFQGAILANCSSILIAHNHPSGDSSPSREDLAVTRRLKECGEILGIDVVDHIIVGEPSQSAQEEGWF